MKNNITLIIKKLTCLFLILAFTACGSGGGDNGSDFIPPFVDPNGGPVLKIDVGNSDSAKKSKVNSFQKLNTESVKAYKLDGTLKGTAEKTRDGLWQIQVEDNTPTLIKALVKNSKDGKATLECLLPITNTSTVFVNTETTKIVYLSWLNAFFQTMDLSDVTDTASLAVASTNDLDSLINGNLLQILIQGLDATDTPAVQVSTAAIYVRKLIALYTVTKKVNEFLSQLESGSLTTITPSSIDGMFSTGGFLDLKIITSSTTATEVTSFINNVISSLVRIKIISGVIVVSSISSPTITESVTLPLTAAEISAMQALFSLSNTPPAFTSTPITTAIVDQLYSYSVTGSDGDGDTITITGTTIPTWLSFNTTTRVLSGTPATTNIGINSVELTITDNKISSVISQTFNITVSGTTTTNATPVITSTAITTITENSLYTYTIVATDAENDALTYSAVKKPSWLSFTASTGVLSGSPTASNIGDHDVQLQVTDGNTSALQSFTVTVTAAPENSPPVFATIGTLTATEGVLFSKTFSATDPDDDTVTLAAKSLPAWLTFNATTGVLSGTPANSDFTLDKVILTATDGIITTPVELKFSIKINTIPSFTSNPVKSVIAGSVYSYNIVVSDTDGDTVTLTAPTLPTWLTLSGTSTLLSGAPTISDVGVHEVVLSASDNKAVKSGTQTFSILVLNNLFIAKVNDVEVTNNQTVSYLEKITTLEIAARDTDSDLTFKIKLDGTELVLTNNATTVTLTGASQSVDFIATDSLSVETTISITLSEDSSHEIEIDISGGTLLNESYRKIPGSITFTSSFINSTDTIISKTIQLDDIPQSLNSANEFVLDPLTIAAGTHEIMATISYIDSNEETQTASKTIDFLLVENIKPTQIVKIDSLVINSDTAFSIHQGSSVTITTSNHTDDDGDTITKGLIVDGVLNSDLSSYTATLNAGETKTIKTYLKDPYEESVAYTISLSASATNGGIPVSLSATGSKLSNGTTYRDKLNGVANFATITASLGIDSENDGVSLIEWLVNSVVVTGQNTNILSLDLSTYGGTTVLVIARVTDAFTPSPTVTTATTSLIVDIDSSPTFTSATVNGLPIALTAAISVDHTNGLDKVYVPIASDPEGDIFTFRYTLNNVITTGSQVTIPFSTLTGTTLTVNLMQVNTVVGTNVHNITAVNVVPTPIIIGNTSHVDLNGNYSLIVRPGTDIEGDKLITTVTLNGVPISGVVVNNEIHYSVNLTTLGGTTAVFVVTNEDDFATPISVTFNVAVLLSIAPSGLTAVRGSESITLSWSSVNTATSYNLYYGNAINITTAATKIATITSPYTLSGLTDGLTYYFRVSANHVSGEGILSGTDIPMTPHSAGDTLVVTVNAQAFTFKFIPAGSFTMGAASTETGFVTGEDPQHVVTLSKEYWMLQNEVTQAQWSAIITPAHLTISATPSFNVGATLPVEQISWEDIMGADGFIENLHASDVNTILTSGLYLLPTEAQWENANRSGTTTRFYWGADESLTLIPTYAWYSGNALGTNIVESKTANAWGLFDMSGNVSEWCLDKTPNAYTSAAVTDPTGAASGNERIYRGGSWFDSGNNCRAAKRYSSSKDIIGTNLGFRFIRVPLPTE